MSYLILSMYRYINVMFIVLVQLVTYLLTYLLACAYVRTEGRREGGTEVCVSAQFTAYVLYVSFGMLEKERKERKMERRGEGKGSVSFRLAPNYYTILYYTTPYITSCFPFSAPTSAPLYSVILAFCVPFLR